MSLISVQILSAGLKLFYINIKSCVGNNGLRSDYFELMRGVRRAGRSSFPISFSFGRGNLSDRHYWANEEITGMVINQEETAKLLQPNFLYESAHKLFQLLDNFKEFSGLKVNSAKTEGLWIGSLNDSESKPLGIKWPTEPIKALFHLWPKVVTLKEFLRENWRH